MTRATATRRRGTCPPRTTSPDGFATEGTWYDFFAGKAAAGYGATWGPGFATFQYPNHNRASTIWYHDHALGMTRLNVYAGPAGFYLIRGGPDDVVLDSRTGLPASLPGPAPRENDKFPPNKPYREIAIAIQDRAFNENGSLFYPDTREFFDEIASPYIPDGEFSPIWNPEFFGNMIMVNGNTWPFQTVERRRYRFRFLNGCQSRFLILDFNQIPGVKVWQIGNEGGFLAAPVNLTTGNGNRLLMGLAERADVIVDFTNVPPGNYVLANVGPDEPFGGGEPDEDFDIADPDSTGQVMQFRIVPASRRRRHHPAPVPAAARDHAAAPETVTRPLALIEKMGIGEDANGEPLEGPVEALLGTVDDGVWMEQEVDGPGDREPRARRHRGVGDVQHHRGRPPHAHPRDRLRGRQPRRPRPRRGTRSPRRSSSTATSPRPSRGRPASRTPSSPTPARSPASGPSSLPRPVRVALPHRRTRGQRDDAPLPDRTAAARTARLDGHLRDGAGL